MGLWATGNAKGCGFADCFERMSTRIAGKEQEIDRQIRKIETTADGYTRWQTPLGEFYNHNSNVQFLVAEQMAGAYDVGRCRIHRGDVVLDCGANIGMFTRRALNFGAGQVRRHRGGPPKHRLPAAHVRSRNRTESG